jgi:hypothetical protein
MVGSNNLASIMDHICDDIFFCLKYVKKKSTGDKQENEQESEQEDEIAALCDTPLNLFVYYKDPYLKHSFYSDKKELEARITIIIPPPEAV